ncbi:hypothetical protein Tco_0975640 [Tanacetum coccineum]|uniref:Uncharacterized protein n=1 Tax=Tanacetum coccineum TaxID=301880 RepID=A0ABQ5EF15_9ASTR
MCTSQEGRDCSGVDVYTALAAEVRVLCGLLHGEANEVCCRVMGEQSGLSCGSFLMKLMAFVRPGRLKSKWKSAFPMRMVVYKFLHFHDSTNNMKRILFSTPDIKLQELGRTREDNKMRQQRAMWPSMIKVEGGDTLLAKWKEWLSRHARKREGGADSASTSQPLRGLVGPKPVST